MSHVHRASTLFCAISPSRLNRSFRDKRQSGNLQNIRTLFDNCFLHDGQIGFSSSSRSFRDLGAVEESSLAGVEGATEVVLGFAKDTGTKFFKLSSHKGISVQPDKRASERIILRKCMRLHSTSASRHYLHIIQADRRATRRICRSQ